MEKKLISNDNEITYAQFKLVEDLIIKHNDIYLFRHINPDGDALGSQFAIYEYIKKKFPSKNVNVVGLKTSTNIKAFFDQSLLIAPMDYLGKDIDAIKKGLAIVFDCSSSSRIDGLELYKMAKTKLKFDHHPNIENFEDHIVQSTNYIATCEMVAMFFQQLKVGISLKQAKHLMVGLVTDSGRFMYGGTKARTMRVGAFLIEQGIQPFHDIYNVIYKKDLNEVAFSSYVVKNAKYSKGVISSIVAQKVAGKFEVAKDSIGMFVTSLQSIKNFDYIVHGFYDKEQGMYRLSLRSAAKPINQIAEKYGGGGHALASGVKLKDKKELKALIKDLEKIANE